MTYRLRARVILWGLVLAAGLSAQDGAVDPREVKAAIAELQHTSKELNQAIKLFKADLDYAINHYDHGYHAGPLQVEPADADLGTSENSVAHAAIAKLMIARMLAARSEKYNPAPLADLDHLQDLILKTRSRIDASERLIRRLPVVSVQELGRAQAERKSQHDQLLRGRAAAEEAARAGTLSFPIPLPEAESPEEAKDRAWELTVRGPNYPDTKAEVYKPASQEKPQEVAILPLRWERNRRITLVREPGYRMALTDPGSEDQYGRHLLYQEEWTQSSLSIVKIMRWRVAVDTATGQHILVKRYPVRKHRGDIDDPEALVNLDISWRLEPSIGSSEPGRRDIDSACTNVARDRERLRSVIEDYRIVIRTALAYSDQQAESYVAPDVALAAVLRERLFAIRGHLARAPEILKAEQGVTIAADHLTQSVQTLEGLAAWGNQKATFNGSLEKTRQSESPSPAEWERLQERSDEEINQAVEARAQARAALPPDLSPSEGKFPPLQKNTIVHMVLQPSANASNTVRCLQEVWRFVLAGQSGRNVERIVSLIGIDSKTGLQKVLSLGTEYYRPGPNQVLEGVFDQYAGQDVRMVNLEQ